MSKRIDWAAIEKAYHSTNDSPAKLALQFGVSKRSIEIKAEKDGWKAKRAARQAAQKSDSDYDPRSGTAPRIRQPRTKIDELLIVENAIVSLDSLLYSMCGGNGEEGASKGIDTRGVGGVAGALVRLLEYRRKVEPPTAAELAEIAISLNIRPDEFLTALREAWRLRA